MSLPEYYPAEPVERVPMHPEDYRALLAWVRAKEWRGQEAAALPEAARPCRLPAMGEKDIVRSAMDTGNGYRAQENLSSTK